MKTTKRHLPMKTLPHRGDFHPYHYAANYLAYLYGMLPGLILLMKQKKYDDEIFRQVRTAQSYLKAAIDQHFEPCVRGRIHRRIKSVEKQANVPEELLLLIDEIKYNHAAAEFKKLGKAFYYLKIVEAKAGLV